jgi:hypothetical protein
MGTKVCITDRPIPLRVEISPAVDATMAEVHSLLQPVFERSPQVVLGLVDAFCKVIHEMFSVQGLPALRAGELWFSLEPSARLLDLVAALRAGEFDKGLIICGHDSSMIHPDGRT